jgi:hypothetical protein
MKTLVTFFVIAMGTMGAISAHAAVYAVEISEFPFARTSLNLYSVHPSGVKLEYQLAYWHPPVALWSGISSTRQPGADMVPRGGQCSFLQGGH